MNERDIEITDFSTFENKLIRINEQLVLLDKDVAMLYEIEPKRLKEQLKRNIDKFPKDYAYQLDDSELNLMVSQNATHLSNRMVGQIHGSLLKKDCIW